MSTTPALEPSSTSSTVPDNLTTPGSEPPAFDRVLPTESVTKPGTLVTAESEENEFKSLLSLVQRSSSAQPARALADTICQKIGSDEWTKEFNAFLNSRAGGTIHFGISDDCKVEEGVPLIEKDQDKIKLRIVQLFRHFYPTPLSHYYFVHFIRLENGYYRFDVNIKPSSELRYMSREKTVAYTRSGASCCKLNAEEIERRTRLSSSQRMDDTIKACIEAQIILRIRDAQMAFPIVDSPSYEEKALELLGKYSTMCNIFGYGVRVGRVILQLLRHVVTQVRHGMPVSVARNIASQASDIQLMYRDPGDPSENLYEYLDEKDYLVLTEIYFRIACDGILYCESTELFKIGIVALALLGSVNELARSRYDELQFTVVHSVIDQDKKQKCTAYMKQLVCEDGWESIIEAIWNLD